MQIVIDDEKIIDLLETEWGYEGIREDITRVIRENGTPLPKGHGRILDEKDILDPEKNDGGWYDLVDMPAYIAGVKAIIEADTAERSGEE